MKVLLDTSYLLPLIRVNVEGFEKEELLDVLSSHKVIISNISILELLARGVRFLSEGFLEPQDLLTGIKAILSDERIKIVDSLTDENILELSIVIKKFLDNFIDCILLATALSKADIFLTEDSKILSLEKNKDFKKLKNDTKSSLKILTLSDLKSVKNLQ